MRQQLNELKEMLMEKKKIKEDSEEIETEEEVKPEAEAKAEVEDKTEGEVSEEEPAEEKADNLVIERAAQGVAIYRDYSTESVDTKLKRLVR